MEFEPKTGLASAKFDYVYDLSLAKLRYKKECGKVLSYKSLWWNFFLYLEFLNHVFSPNENIIFYFYIFIDYWDESVENHYQTIFYIMAGPLEIRLMVLPEQQANLSYCHMT